MASDLSFVQYVSEQIGGAGAISFRKMFGEYAVYCNGKVVALVCDNQLYVKPTAAGHALAEDVKQAPPYPGAKPYFLIDERLDDRHWVAALVLATERDLPVPKARSAMPRSKAITARSTRASQVAAKPAPAKSTQATPAAIKPAPGLPPKAAPAKAYPGKAKRTPRAPKKGGARG